MAYALTHRFCVGPGESFEDLGPVQNLLVEGMKIGELQSFIGKRVEFTKLIEELEERDCKPRCVVEDEICSAVPGRRVVERIQTKGKPRPPAFILLGNSGFPI